MPMNANKTIEAELMAKQAAVIEKELGIKIVIDFVPTLLSTEYAAFLSSLHNANSTEYQIYLIDVIWPGQYAERFYDITWLLNRTYTREFIPSIFEAGYAGGRQVSVPYFADYGLLYYRRDILSRYNFTGPPKTWEEMERMMDVIVPEERKRNPRFFGYIGQFRAYEGLTCNLVELIASVGGGSFVEPNKTISLNNPRVHSILTRFKTWLFPPKSYVPLASLFFDETSSLNKWLDGDTLFLRHWPFVFAHTRTAGRFAVNGTDGRLAYGVAPLPGDVEGRSAAALGGWQMAVNSRAENPELAVKVIERLTSKEFQLQRFKTLGSLPTIGSLYSDAAFCALNPQCDVLASLNVVARPVTGTSPNYLAASEQIFRWGNSILRDEVSVKDGLKKMEENLKAIVKPPVELGEPDSIGFTEPLGIGALTFGGLIMVAMITFYGTLLQLSRTRKLPYTTPVFLTLIAGGVLLSYVGVITEIGVPNTARCTVKLWGTAGSYSLVVSAFTAKNWRVYKIYRNSYKRKSLPDSELLRTVVALVAVDVIVLCVWTLINPPGRAATVLEASTYYICQSPNVTVGWVLFLVLLVYNIILIITGVWVSHLTKDVEGPFSELKFNGFTIYTLAAFNCVLVPLSFVDGFGLFYQFLLRVVALEFSAISILIITFVPIYVELTRVVTAGGGGDGSGKAKRVRWDTSDPTKGMRLYPPPVPVAGAGAGSGGGGGSANGEGGGEGEQQPGVGAVAAAMWWDMEKVMVKVKYGKTMFALWFCSFKEMRMLVVPQAKVLILHALVPKPTTGLGVHQGAEFHTMNHFDLHPGLAIQVKSIKFLPPQGVLTTKNGQPLGPPCSSDLQYPLRCIINGTRFEFRFKSAALLQYWTTVLEKF
ncbi:hypothetical protein HDU96_009598, partial [Phlyctochytrium bullatum]